MNMNSEIKAEVYVQLNWQEMFRGGQDISNISTSPQKLNFWGLQTAPKLLLGDVYFALMSEPFYRMQDKTIVSLWRQSSIGSK